MKRFILLTLFVFVSGFVAADLLHSILPLSFLRSLVLTNAPSAQSEQRAQSIPDPISRVSQPELDPEWVPNPDRPLRPQLAIYAASEPQKAAALAVRIPWTGDEEEDPPINDPIGTVMRAWGKSDPRAATDFYDKLTEPARKLGAAFGLVHGLAAYDVEHAAKWVEKNVRHPDAVAFMAIVVPYMQQQRAERWLAGLPLDEYARELTRGLVSARLRLPVLHEQ